MKRAADHDKYLGIMNSICQAEELQEKDKQKEENKPPLIKTCFNCGKKKSCKKFNGKLSFNGSYSIGGNSHNESCDHWCDTKKKAANDPKQVKSLLKQFSKKFKLK